MSKRRRAASASRAAAPPPRSEAPASPRVVVLWVVLGLSALVGAGVLIVLWPEVFGVIFGIVAVSLLLLVFAPGVLGFFADLRR